MRHFAETRLGSMRRIRKVVALFIASLKQDDMLTLQDLLAAGKVTPVIDRQYQLSEVPAALSYLNEGHARGKVAISV